MARTCELLSTDGGSEFPHRPYLLPALQPCTVDGRSKVCCPSPRASPFAHYKASLSIYVICEEGTESVLMHVGFALHLHQHDL